MEKGPFLRAVSPLVIVACLVLPAMPIMAPACATPAVPGIAIKGLILETSYKIVIEIASVSPNDVSFDEVGLVLITPVVGSPGEAGTAKYHSFLHGAAFNYSAKIHVRYEANTSGSLLISPGDKIIIETNEFIAIPDGEWQLYLTYTPIHDASMAGLIWTTGHSPTSDQELPFARSSISDPMTEFGLRPKGDDYAFLFIFLGEAALLAIMVLLIGRRER